MTASLSIWLSVVITAGLIIWSNPNLRQALIFAFGAALLLPVVFMPLGHAANGPPPGDKFTVLGARIDVDKAIYVLIDAQPEPRYYRLPYSTGAANQLQVALDGAADGEGGVQMGTGADGEPSFEESHSTPDIPKQPDTAPILGG